MIDLSKVKIGSKIRLTAQLDDPWTKLKAGTIGEVFFIQQRCGYDFPPVISCRWEDGSTLGVFLDDPVELMP